jgi:hypothetical protein
LSSYPSGLTCLNQSNGLEERARSSRYREPILGVWCAPEISFEKDTRRQNLENFQRNTFIHLPDILTTHSIPRKTNLSFSPDWFKDLTCSSLPRSFHGYFVSQIPYWTTSTINPSSYSTIISFAIPIPRSIVTWRRSSREVSRGSKVPWSMILMRNLRLVSMTRGGQMTEWKDVCVWDTMSKIVSRASNRVFVGLPLCKVPSDPKRCLSNGC